MIFRFLLLSDEVDNFKREIQIDAEATFFDFYQSILKTTGYSDKELASFVICDNSWRKQQEITLIEMDTASDEDSYTMEESVLNDFLEDEKQKLMFVFDLLNERALYIELSEIITGKNLSRPKITKSIGEAPEQTRSIEDIKTIASADDLGETFYGDEDFDIDELDKSGFDGLDDLPADIASEDLF